MEHYLGRQPHFHAITFRAVDWPQHLLEQKTRKRVQLHLLKDRVGGRVGESILFILDHDQQRHGPQCRGRLLDVKTCLHLFRRKRPVDDLP